MDDIITRLLDAELQAEALVAEAKHKYDQLMQQAQDDARAADAAFELRIPELRNQYVSKERERAAQTIAELKRRYEERHREQHALAEQRSAEALESALAILLDAERG